MTTGKSVFAIGQTLSDEFRAPTSSRGQQANSATAPGGPRLRLTSLEARQRSAWLSISFSVTRAGLVARFNGGTLCAERHKELFEPAWDTQCVPVDMLVNPRYQASC